MKILVVCQHYWPEPYPLVDLCEEMVKRGHVVHVVTGVPNYPMGYIYDDYKKGKNREQERNGVRITRTFTIGRKNNIVFRLLNYMSYSISSTLYIHSLRDEYDVVFMNQTSPVMMSNAGVTYAKKWKKKGILYCMDLWPASLAAGGMKETSPIYKVFGWISKKIYRQADEILITSQMFRNYLKEQFGISDEKIVYLPQYANAQFDSVATKEESEEIVNFVFAGNIGAAQSLDTVLRAAKILNERKLKKELIWNIVGDGSELENLKKLASELELTNVVFHGRKPVEQMPKYYEMADAMVVSLTSDKFITLTLPGKVQTYMAAGKPILATADGEIPNIIHESKCGFCAKAEDSEAFADAVMQFLNSENVLELGKNARAYYTEHFTRDIFMNKLETELLSAVKQGMCEGAYEAVNR